MKSRILVVDDEESTREYLSLLLTMDGHEVEAVPGAAEALEIARSRPIHLLITDLYMPETGGMDLLSRVRSEHLPFGVIVVTAYGDPQIALAAMKAGADDFVTKPFEPDRLRLLVNRTLERRQLCDELEHLRQQMREDYSFLNMVSKNDRMRQVFDLIEQVGPLGSTVLIHGETGTGKELVAQAIHAASGRRDRKWVPVNCAALSDSLLESELFGHERGAFTGADRRRVGRFEAADGGTLFLDEIGDVSPAMQAKLLRVLQTGNFERVGGTETLKVDVRIVAASNKRLDELVRQGVFRSDLYYRLRVVPIDLPPLRDRREDIPLLAMHFLNKLAARSTPPVTEIDPEAMHALYSYNWPGNIRELENAIKAAVALADGTMIHRSNLPPSIVPRADRPASTLQSSAETLLDLDRPLPELTETIISRVERDYFAELLALYKGNVARCARHSGLSRRCVTQKLAKYGLDRTQFKDNASTAILDD
ncbi:sigma-54 dependent transcriptional regulator [Tautonia sp. JC769]|uniref:sigma-54-dependent transcriptional regulator n=1 Tax=Tautonia sp. JC769 TaxID=3232135 RepID=UPI0034596735